MCQMNCINELYIRDEIKFQKETNCRVKLTHMDQITT